MAQLVKLYQESHLGKRLPAYDGRKSLYTAGALPFQAKEFKIILIDEDDGTGGQRLFFIFLSILFHFFSYPAFCSNGMLFVSMYWVQCVERCSTLKCHIAILF
jgi:hypothetical protein